MDLATARCAYGDAMLQIPPKIQNQLGIKPRKDIAHTVLISTIEKGTG